MITSPTGPQGARCGEVIKASQRQGQGSLRKASKRWSRESTELHGAACYFEGTVPDLGMPLQGYGTQILAVKEQQLTDQSAAG